MGSTGCGEILALISDAEGGLRIAAREGKYIYRGKSQVDVAVKM